MLLAKPWLRKEGSLFGCEERREAEELSLRFSELFRPLCDKLFPRKDEGFDRREPLKVDRFKSVWINKLVFAASDLFALSGCSLGLIRTGFSMEQLLE